MKSRVLVEPDENGVFVAEVPGLNGKAPLRREILEEATR
jgi:predicted RNase H-like HicB family nuclease